MPPTPQKKLGASVKPPHPATLVQPKRPLAGIPTRPPHPAATLVQPKRRLAGIPARPPHPATLPRSRPAHAAKVASWTLQRMEMVGPNEANFKKVFKRLPPEFWKKWEELLPGPLYALLRYFQGRLDAESVLHGYLGDADKVFSALVALNRHELGVIGALEKFESENGFKPAHVTESESQTELFLDLIAKKLPLIDYAADSKTGFEDFKHGRLTHRIQWWIIGHNLVRDPEGKSLLEATGASNLADVYAKSASYRKYTENAGGGGKLIAPWTAMLDRPIINHLERLNSPDATVPENLGFLLFAGNFENIIDAELALWKTPDDYSDPMKMHLGWLPLRPRLV